MTPPQGETMYLREYELMFIVKPETDEAAIEQISEKLSAATEEGGGVKLHMLLWGRKRLAYEIQDFNKGLFYLYGFLGDAKTVTALERALKFEEVVLRFMTTKISDRVEVEARKERANAEEAARVAKRAKEEEEARKAAEERAYWEEKARKAAEKRDAEAAAAAGPAEPAPASAEEPAAAEDEAAEEAA